MSKHAMTNPHAPAKSRKGKPAATATAPETAANISLDAPAAPAVTSESNTESAASMPPAAVAPARSMKTMELTLTKSTAPRKSKRIVIYNIEGRTGSVQFLSTLFGGSQKDEGNPPEKLTLTGEFAEPKVAKAKETKEERKARLAALPKLTLAERVAKAEEKANKLREKLAKAAAAANAPATPAEGAAPVA